MSIMEKQNGFIFFPARENFCDNGTWQPVRAGDVTVTPDGCGHALRNTGSVPLEFVALILDS